MSIFSRTRMQASSHAFCSKLGSQVYNLRHVSSNTGVHISFPNCSQPKRQPQNPSRKFTSGTYQKCTYQVTSLCLHQKLHFQRYYCSTKLKILGPTLSLALLEQYGGSIFIEIYHQPRESKKNMESSGWKQLIGLL